jgi:hypothetical protein
METAATCYIGSDKLWLLLLIWTTERITSIYSDEGTHASVFYVVTHLEFLQLLF